MRNMVFKINGTDLSASCNQYGFRSGITPVYSNEVETMDRVRRSTVVRWRGWCDVPLNDISDADAKAFAAALRGTGLSISYYNAALGTQVTQEMTVDGLELAYLLQDVSGRFWSGQTLHFTQR